MTDTDAAGPTGLTAERLTELGRLADAKDLPRGPWFSGRKSAASRVPCDAEGKPLFWLEKHTEADTDHFQATVHIDGEWATTDYIAACDPDTVKALLADLAHARAAGDRLRAACELFLRYDGENCQTGQTHYDDVKAAVVAALADWRKESP